MKINNITSMFYRAKNNTFEKANELRNNMTEAEKTIWERLNKSQLGVRFKAQHPIDIFIADFYCHRCKLVIEVDGRHT
jgi:very-short-patch-repair endonuclease